MIGLVGAISRCGCAGAQTPLVIARIFERTGETRFSRGRHADSIDRGAVHASRKNCKVGAISFDRNFNAALQPTGSKMSKLMIAMFISAGLGFAGSAAAQMRSPITPATPMSKDNYAMAKTNADAQYKTDMDACSSLKGNTKDICVAEAKGKDSVAKADAEAAYENTPKARQAARVAHAQANYNVAIEKCDDLAGNRKDVCVKEAKAELVKGKANAKVDRVAAETNKEAATKQADARTEAATDKRDAEYKVAIEKCDALAGPAKDACVSNAKAQFGKS